MRKRLVVSALAMAALVAVSAPAFAQSKSTHRALRSSVRAVNARSVAAAHPGSPLANWTNLPNMNKGVAEVGGGALAQKKVYVPGGYDSAGTVTGQMQIFNTQTNTWSTDADLLSNLTGLPGVVDAAICADTTGKIHVVNGSLDGLSIYTSHLVFDPLAPVGSKWSFLTNPNTVADGNFYSQDSGCAFIGGKMYLFTGYGLTDLQGAAQMERLTWVYDPTTDSWSDTGKLLITGRFWHGYAATASRAFVAGGTDNVTTFAPITKTETFTVTGGWKAMANLPAARLAPGMGLLGSTIAVFGGMTGSFATINTTVGCVGGTGCGPGPWNDLAKNLNAGRGFSAWASGGGKLYDAGGFTSTFAVLASAESTA